MLLNEWALIVCLFLLFAAGMSTAAAARQGDLQRVRVLCFFRLGLGLSACAYALHLSGGRQVNVGSLLALGCSFVGTLMIWIGWMEHWGLIRARRRAALSTEEDDDAAVAESTGLPPVNSQTRLVLLYAQREAHHRHQCCVDTDHLLLGLMCEPRSASGLLLGRLGVEPKNIFVYLGQPVGAVDHQPRATSPRAADPLPLTDRARQALGLAAQEAHRFDKSFVGTDHLLLGLVLTGRGAATDALFREGVTVEQLRSEVLKSRARA